MVHKIWTFKKLFTMRGLLTSMPKVNASITATALPLLHTEELNVHFIFFLEMK